MIILPCMFGIGLPEMIIILVVALLVVGPTKLPELARTLGKAFKEFRRMADDVKETFEQEVMKEEEVKTTDTEEGARVEEKILEEAKQPEALHSRSGNDNKPT
ncbi:MAG: TatA/E family twin arginine-targeting protein translocase [Syntrophorhabdus sp.]|nr:TatA/E family twin arginine-targeting protein translocase [Pseudomonadota bacterium]HNS78998.1 TatA/E family twin arginine-targeting protein translocase [Syntrophorhabdus sp.]HQB33457.1 TatA/E family twin arginine-targeting protein translocase [Syntrophorhabdus sp.]HQG26362.1 TatA/E family twin arginine-targeting protein translocase [Syntrophorhabdus sp.]